MSNFQKPKIFSIHDNGGNPYTVVIRDRPFFIEPTPICNTTINVYNNGLSDWTNNRKTFKNGQEPNAVLPLYLLTTH